MAKGKFKFVGDSVPRVDGVEDAVRIEHEANWVSHVRTTDPHP